jgi:ornithine cyclodeaminase/alanine dehydrogenase-like protein (mu-crystallin family)
VPDVTYLTREDVVAAGGADMRSAIDDLVRGLHLYEAGLVMQPAKTSVRLSGRHSEAVAGLVNFLPAAVAGEDPVFGCKAMGAMPANLERGLPRATGLITLFDATSKLPIAVMDAQVISAIRTGAVSALMGSKLAPPDTTSVGLIGAGVNMRTQLLGLKTALPGLRRVRVYSRGLSKHAFAAQMGERVGVEIVAVDTAQEAVRDQRLVVTCVANASRPVVRAAWLAPAVTVFNIGCYEVEVAALARMDRIVADNWEHGKHRGVQTHAIAHQLGVIDDSRVEDMTPIANGRRPGRRNDQESIFFSPTGMGFEDVLLARRVLRTALARGLGQTLSLWSEPQWI